MKLARVVLHPHRPGTVLLRKRFVLDESTIVRLEELRVGEVWVEFPPLAFIGEHVSPEVHRLRGATMQLVGSAFERIGAGEASVDLHYADYSSAIRDLCKAIVDDPRASMCLEHLAEGDVALSRHSAEVAYLSLLLGLRLDGYIIDQRRRVSAYRAKDIVNLGLGAMLHDIGLVGTSLEAETGLPEVDIAKVSGDSQAFGAERVWLEHSARGYQMVRGSLHPSASAIVLNHHQACDGFGFPGWRALDALRLSGMGVGEDERVACDRAADGTPAPGFDDIHVFARIVAVADTFDRLRYASGDRPLPIVAAQRMMLGQPWCDRLDPVVLRALLAVVPAYGPGTLVRLSDGRHGAVIATHADDPCRPVVQVLFEDWAERTAGYCDDTTVMRERLDLRRCPELSIVEADGCATDEHNFSLDASVRSNQRRRRGPSGSRGHAA